MKIVAGRVMFLPKQSEAKLAHGTMYDLIMANTPELIRTFPNHHPLLRDEEYARLLEEDRAAYDPNLAGLMCPQMMQAMASSLPIKQRVPSPLSLL